MRKTGNVYALRALQKMKTVFAAFVILTEWRSKANAFAGKESFLYLMGLVDALKVKCADQHLAFLALLRLNLMH